MPLQEPEAEQEEVLVEVQLSVELEPLLIELGLAENVSVGELGPGGGVGVGPGGGGGVGVGGGVGEVTVT